MNSFTPQQIEEFLQEFFDVVGARQYVGARYVPIFGRAGEDTIEWDDLAPYEPLTVVMHEGVSYVSRRYVPNGIQITDTSYWVQTYRFNAQVEQYRQQVIAMQGDIDDRVPFPDPLHYPRLGVLGQVLTTLADGTTKWEDPVVPSDAQAEAVITEWLNDHPEATTTVQDGAITLAKLATSLRDSIYQARNGIPGTVVDVNSLLLLPAGSYLVSTNDYTDWVPTTTKSGMVTVIRSSSPTSNANGILLWCTDVQQDAGFYMRRYTYITSTQSYSWVGDWVRLDDTTIANNSVTDAKLATAGIKSALNYPALNTINTTFLPMLNYVKYFAVYADYSQYTPAQVNSFNMRICGYYVPENRFYVTIYDGARLQSFIKTYDVMPTSGFEWIEFTPSPSTTNMRCEMLVDWSAYSTDYYVQTSASNGLRIYPLSYDTFNAGIFVGNGTNLSIMPKNKSILQGTFTLDSQFTLESGKQLRGDNATINVSSGGQIVFKDNCLIENIQFIGNWAPERTTQGDHYAPLITMQNLSDGSTDALYGSGLDYDDAVIYSGTSYNSYLNSKIRGCRFKGLDRPCITVIGGSHRDAGSYDINGCTFEDCRCGIVIRGQFARVHENCYFRCIVGLIINAGNLCKIGEVFKGCDCGIYYPASVGNGGHGEGSGLEIAHSGLAGIYIKELQYPGDIYTGCHIVDSPIIGESVLYLMWTAGKLDTYVAIASGTNCAFTNNMVSIDYIGSNPLYTVPASTYVSGNIPMRNATDDQVNNRT